MARTDFRAAAARRLSEDRELSPAIVSLLSPDSPTRSVGVRIVPVDHIEPNPEQPRMVFDADGARRAGRVDPRARRPPADPRPAARTRTATRSSPASAAGARRRQAGLETIPALIEEIDDDTALEISIIENLQREDLSPLDEAAMYDRMVHEHGYSIRKLADKLGKDKGYLENRLRLADAPPEIRELVSLRKDTLSHAYELMKVEDPKKRRRLAAQVARGELTLIKLRDKIEGRRARPAAPVDDVPDEVVRAGRRRRRSPTTPGPIRCGRRTRRARPRDLATTRWSTPSSSLSEAVEELVGVLGDPGRPRIDRRDGPGEPREVPDDRQAPARERDRDGPERRRRLLSGLSSRTRTNTARCAAAGRRARAPGSRREAGRAATGTPRRPAASPSPSGAAARAALTA